jgi:hypothetical protein
MTRAHKTSIPAAVPATSATANSSLHWPSPLGVANSDLAEIKSIAPDTHRRFVSWNV